MPRWRTMIEPARDELAVAGLDAEALADAVAAVLDAAACLLVCHRVYSSFFVARVLASARRLGRRRRRPWPSALVGRWPSRRGLGRGFGVGLASALRLRASALARRSWPRRRVGLRPPSRVGLRSASWPARRPRLDGELGGELGVLGGLRGGGLLEALALGLGLVARPSSAALAALLPPSVMSADAQDRQLLAMALLDPAARLRAVLEGDELVAAGLADDLGADRGVRDERPADRRVVAVGDEQDAIERDRLAGLDVEQLDLELGADLDAVLLPAGLDDCVHGSSGRCGWRPRAAIATSDMGRRPAGPRRERGVYGRAPTRSIVRGVGRTGASSGSSARISRSRTIASSSSGRRRAVGERGDDLLRAARAELGWKRVRVRTTTGGPALHASRSTSSGRRS